MDISPDIVAQLRRGGLQDDQARQQRDEEDGRPGRPPFTPIRTAAPKSPRQHTQRHPRDGEADEVAQHQPLEVACGVEVLGSVDFQQREGEDKADGRHTGEHDPLAPPPTTDKLHHGRMLNSNARLLASHTTLHRRDKRRLDMIHRRRRVAEQL